MDRGERRRRAREVNRRILRNVRNLLPGRLPTANLNTVKGALELSGLYPEASAVLLKRPWEKPMLRALAALAEKGCEGRRYRKGTRHGVPRLTG